MTSELQPSPALPAETGKSSTAKSSTGVPLSWIEKLFERLSAYYGARFADMWRGCDLEGVKQVWAAELGDCTRDEIARGVAACRTRDWPPTLPEFLKLCRPAIDYERAFIEAVEQMRRRERGEDAWSTPAVFWAAVKLGGDLRANPYPAIRCRWQSALDDAIAGIRSGALPGEIPPRREALPPPGQTSVPPEVARQRIAAMRDSLARKMTMQ